MKRDGQNQSKNDVLKAQNAKARADIEKALRTGIKAGAFRCW